MQKREAIEQRMLKMAQLTLDMGEPSTAGRGIADIVRFLMQRIPDDKRVKLMNSLRNKLWTLNETEIASKKLVPGSALGQSITFVKNVLMGHSPAYIRAVLKQIVLNLH